MRRKLEKQHVEKPVCDWADSRLIMHRKLNGEGKRGWPDREFFLPGGKPFLIEFKRPGEEPDPLQLETIGALRALGYDVEVHDDKNTAIAAILKRQRERARIV